MIAANHCLVLAMLPTFLFLAYFLLHPLPACALVAAGVASRSEFLSHPLPVCALHYFTLMLLLCRFLSVFKIRFHYTEIMLRLHQYDASNFHDSFVSYLCLFTVHSLLHTHHSYASSFRMIYFMCFTHVLLHCVRFASLHASYCFLGIIFVSKSN